MRMFRLVMGNTVFTAATVLTVFMGGLGLGAYVSGRLTHRFHRPLFTYALIEGAVGVYALLLLAFFGLAEPVYGWVYSWASDSVVLLGVGRFVVSSALLIFPTTLLGATLPLLCRFVSSSRKHLGRDVGRLYGLNTLGAATGAAITGFLLIPKLGVMVSTIVAAVANLLIMAICIWLSLRFERQDITEEADSDEFVTSNHTGSAAIHLVWMGMSGAGFASMVYEVAWTRLLTLMIGSSVYAFTLMLVAFIAGLGLGGAILGGWIDRIRNQFALFGVLEVIVGITVLCILPIMHQLPSYVVPIVTSFAGSFQTLLTIEFLLVFALMVVPTFVMGGIFPLAAKIVSRHLNRVDRSVGEIYAANTLGAVFGSFAAGFILIPAFGVQSTIFIGVAINIAIGVFFLIKGSQTLLPRIGAVGIVLVALSAMVLFPTPDPLLLNSAPYLYAHRYEGKETRDAIPLERVMKKNRRLLFAEDGLTASVTVVESAGELYLKVNGKTDASSKGDLRSQSLLSHLPLILHSDPSDVLLVGLGSGISLGAAEQHPVKRIECVEISTEVAAACRLFGKVNNDALADPRLDLFIGDGRNHLAFSDRLYDVIISQPSNLWIAGMADLFTKEFYDVCAKHLKPGGLMCTWIQAYMMKREDFTIVVKTFREQFRHVTMWESVPGGDYFLIGSQDPISIDADQVQSRIYERGLEIDLARIGVGGRDNLLCSYVMADSQIDAFVEEAGSQVNSDDNALLEFSAPEGLYAGLMGQAGLFDAMDLEAIRQRDLHFITGTADERLRRAWMARRQVLAAIGMQHKGRFDEALRLLDSAHDLEPGDMELKRQYPPVGYAVVATLLDDGRHGKAKELLERVVKIAPAKADGWLRLGQVSETLGHFDDAITAYLKALDVEPRFVLPYVRLVDLHFKGNALEKVDELLAQALVVDPDDVSVLDRVGKLRLRQGDFEAAIEAFHNAHRLAPTDAELCNNIGVVYLQSGDSEKSIYWFRKATAESPTYGRAFTNLGQAHIRENNISEAREAITRALELDPTDTRARSLHAVLMRPIRTGKL